MLEGRGDGSCLGLKGWIDNEIGAGQVSVSCKLAAVFLYDVVWHLIFRLEGNVNNLDVMNGLYLLLSTNNFILCTTRKSDEAGPSPHNILTRVRSYV